MAHVNFNHLNATAFNSFVPVATKTANNQLFKNVLIVGGLALVVWGIYKVSQSKKVEIKEVQE
jgi:predicted metal-binding membrane protein